MQTIDQVPDAVRDNRTAARAPNTRRMLAHGWRRWREWAAARGVPELPAESDALELFLVVHLAGECGVGWATISSTMWAINAAHREAALAPPGDGAQVRRALQGLRRRLGRAPKQARPLTVSELARLAFPDTRQGARDKALLLLGFAAALRRAELAALEVRDIERAGDGLLVTVRRSKTDQEGRGATIYVAAAQRFPALCPVAALEAWLAWRGDGPGPLFPGWRGALTGVHVDRIVKRYAAAAGLGAGYSGHSLRAGCATWLYQCGVAVPDIARHGRWKSYDMVLRYCRGDTAAAVRGTY